ncbi:TetR-like C-terminal domain-containing protein [Nonomuraea sp. NPDC048881]|uniref:TetR-like C-terminal domain-containing protein n=1 Tax=Nonomuraea sp. NPDC048881 TaxID=3155030 RepID=UPI003407C3AA
MLNLRSDAVCILVAIQSGTRPANERCRLVTSVPAIMAGRRAITHVAVPDTGSFEGDLRVVVSDPLALWGHPGVARLTRQMYGEAGRDPAVAEIVRTGMRTRMRRSQVVYMPDAEEVVHVLGRGFTPT